MSDFIPFNRDQSFLLPPDLKRWLPEDDLAHFVIAAVERVGLSAFQVKARAGGKAQYHPRLMLALLIYAYANGIFSSRRIERASYRDIGVRFVAANLHPCRGDPTFNDGGGPKFAITAGPKFSSKATSERRGNRLQSSFSISD